MTKRMTVVMVALVAMPALASAQDSTRQGTQVDSARTNMQSQNPSTSSGRSGTMRGRRSSSGMGLSRDQVMQLQTALSGAGCDAGTADGVVGPKTRRAITCARQKNNVSSNAELYRSLNLDFGNAAGGIGAGRSGAGATTRNSQGMAADAAAAKATHGDSAQVGGTNRGRIYPPADSVRKRVNPGDSTKRDSTSH